VSQLSVVVSLVLVVFVFVCLVFCRPSAACLLYPVVVLLRLWVGLEPEYFKTSSKFCVCNLDIFLKSTISVSDLKSKEIFAKSFWGVQTFLMDLIVG